MERSVYLLVSSIEGQQVIMRLFVPQFPDFPIDNFLKDIYRTFTESIIFHLPYQIDSRLFYTINHFFILKCPHDELKSMPILFTMIIPIENYEEINNLHRIFMSLESLLLQFKQNLVQIEHSYYLFHPDDPVPHCLNKNILSKIQADIKERMRKIHMIIDNQMKTIKK